MKKLFIVFALSIIAVVGVAFHTQINATGISTLDYSGDDGGSTTYYASKQTSVCHSPVASSYFYSKVSYTLPVRYVSLYKWNINSDLVCSVKKASASGKAVVFTYQGFDSNYAQYSGTTSHNYSDLH